MQASGASPNCAGSIRWPEFELFPRTPPITQAEAGGGSARCGGPRFSSSPHARGSRHETASAEAGARRGTLGPTRRDTVVPSATRRDSATTPRIFRKTLDIPPRTGPSALPGRLALARCRVFGNPLGNEFSHFAAGNSSAFFRRLNPPLDSGGSFGIHRNFFLGGNERINQLTFGHASNVCRTETLCKPGVLGLSKRIVNKCVTAGRNTRFPQESRTSTCNQVNFLHPPPTLRQNLLRKRNVAFGSAGLPRPIFRRGDVKPWIPPFGW